METSHRDFAAHLGRGEIRGNEGTSPGLGCRAAEYLQLTASVSGALERLCLEPPQELGNGWPLVFSIPTGLH